MKSRNCWRASLLWLLQALFALRVLGQVYVGLYQPTWLPVWREWYSGLLHYPVLLPAQLVLLMLMTLVSYDNTRSVGRLHIESIHVRHWLKVAAALYVGIMLMRYVLTMLLVPEMRWLHGTLPIAFHLVLAAYLFVLSRKPI